MKAIIAAIAVGLFAVHFGASHREAALLAFAAFMVWPASERAIADEVEKRRSHALAELLRHVVYVHDPTVIDDGNSGCSKCAEVRERLR